MPPTEEPDPRPEHAPTIRAARAPELSTPTFPSDAESLLNHIKLGAARAPARAADGAFPVVPNYEIESELGRGGMGVVYKAKHTGLHHTVAIKMLLSAARASAGEVARFLAEAEAIALVKHPNVVQVFDLGEADGRPYFVMEYVAGGTLADLLEAGRLDPARAAALVEAVARGVQAAHEQDIVHRDLKPGNVLLQIEDLRSKIGAANEAPQSAISNPQSAIPKVSDFGLAKRLASDLTRSQAVMGTPQYMAPEQAGGKAKFVGPGADVYALGTILYECLTGALPFGTEGDAWSLIRQVVDDAPEPPRKRVPGVPRDLELICLKCLEKEPHHRYPTAAALADDLRRFLSGQPVSVRPIGTVTRAARWAKRRPAPAALVALAVLLVLVVPPLVIWQQGRLDRRDADTTAAREREDAAQRIADAANAARTAAETLAAARELFALQNALRTRAAERPLEWTAATRADLPRAVALAGTDPETVHELRSHAAAALLAPDLFPRAPVATTMTACALAVDPTSGLVAVGEFKGRGSCRIALVDPATGRVARALTYTTAVFVDGQDGTRALAFSPDGTRLFAGTRYARVLRFDLTAPGKTPAKEWKGKGGSVDKLAVSADGKTVYMLATPEPTIQRWDADTGAAGAPLAPDAGFFRTFALLPKGEILANTGGHQYRFGADRTRPAKLTDVDAQRVVSATGALVLAGDGPNLAIRDRDTGLVTDRLADPALRLAAHEEYIKDIALHPTGAFAATASGDTDRTVKVWELASGRLVGTVVARGTDPIRLAWSADGNYLLATAAGHVARWEFVPGQRFACASARALAAMTPLPDGRVAAISADISGRRDVFLGPLDGTAACTFFQEVGGNSRPGMSADPAGVLAVTENGPGIYQWRPGTVPPRRAFTEAIAWCPHFSPDGTTLWALVDAKEIRAFDPATAQTRGKWRNGLAEFVSGLASLDALAVGRTAAVVGGRDGTVYVCDPATCQPTSSYRTESDPVHAVGVVPDGALVVAGTQSGKLRTIRPADKKELPAVSAHPGGVTALALSADGAVLVTAGRDRAVRFWRRAGDRFEPLFAVTDLPGAARDLRFDAAGTRLLVLLGHEHAVRAWDVAALKRHHEELKLGW